MSPARALDVALTPLPRRVNVPISGVVLAAVALTARTAALLSPFAPHPSLTVAAATFDLTVTTSVLAWWMLGRDFAWTPRALVPLFLGSLILAAAALPKDLEGPLRAMHVAAAPLELVLLVYLGRRIVRARRAARAPAAEGAGEVLDVQDVLAAATADVVGRGRLAEILADEMSVLWYALAARAGRAPAVGDGLTYHRKTSYGAVVFALVLATAAEVPAMHLLVRLWSERAAWVLTALGLYGILWILGDWRACRLRPVRVEGGALRIRFGLRWRIDVPLDAVTGVRAPTAAERSTRRSVDLRLALPGASWRVLELDREVVAVGMYGRRRHVRTLGLGVDEPERLRAVLDAARAAAPSD
jgi:hypothetical protein